MVRKYTKDHEWIEIDGNVATVGITAFATEQLGDVVFVEQPEIGAEFNKGDACAVVESVKAASDVYAPLTGKILEVNTKIVDEPALLNENSEENYFFKIEMSNPSECDEHLSEEAYKKEISA